MSLVAAIHVVKDAAELAKSGKSGSPYQEEVAGTILKRFSKRDKFAISLEPALRLMPLERKPIAEAVIGTESEVLHGARIPGVTAILRAPYGPVAGKFGQPQPGKSPNAWFAPDAFQMEETFGRIFIRARIVTPQ